MWQGAKHYLDPNNERWELLIIEGWRQEETDQLRSKHYFDAESGYPAVLRLRLRKKK